MKDSREARLEATRLMREQMDAETAAFKEQIEQQTADAIAQSQANHDAEMQRMFEETLDTAKKEVEEKYNEICKLILNAWEDGDDIENDDRLEWLSDNQRTKIANDMKDFRRKASIQSLWIQLTHFKSFWNNRLQKISLYWEAPEDFIEDCKAKRDEIERLIGERQKELNWE